MASSGFNVSSSVQRVFRSELAKARAAAKVGPMTLASSRAFTLAQLSELIGGARAKLVHAAALNRIGENLVTYAKRNATFTDRTTFLRRSITFEPAREADDGSTEMVFYAGANYAGYVEALPGYWVLSGALIALRPLIKNWIGETVREQDILFATGGTLGEAMGTDRYKRLARRRRQAGKRR